jgi:hypothetical protein
LTVTTPSAVPTAAYENPGPANKAEPPRDYWGRYKLPHPNNENGKQYGYQRVTTFAKVLDDTYNLDRWRNRQTVIGLLKRPDLLALAATITEPDSEQGKKDLNEICEKAQEAAGTSIKANLGSALHSYCEQLLAGASGDQIPQQFHADILAYRRELSRLGIVELPYFSERVVFNEHFEVSGRFDRIVQLPDGTLCIADIKTRDGDLDMAEQSIAVQLATYANSGWIRNYETSRWEKMPNVRKDIALVIHLPVGKAEAHVYQVNITAGWWGSRVAAEGQAWRKTKQLFSPFIPEHTPKPLEHPTPDQLQQGLQPAPQVPINPAPEGAVDPFATQPVPNGVTEFANGTYVPPIGVPVAARNGQPTMYPNGGPDPFAGQQSAPSLVAHVDASRSPGLIGFTNPATGQLEPINNQLGSADPQANGDPGTVAGGPTPGWLPTSQEIAAATPPPRDPFAGIPTHVDPFAQQPAPAGGPLPAGVGATATNPGPVSNGHVAWSSAQQANIAIGPDGQPQGAAVKPHAFQGDGLTCAYCSLGSGDTRANHTQPPEQPAVDQEKRGPGRPAKPPLDPKTATVDELAGLPKAKLQDLLRGLDPGANLARQRKNLAQEIVQLRDAMTGKQQPATNTQRYGEVVAQTDVTGEDVVLSSVVSNAPGPVPPDPAPQYPAGRDPFANQPPANGAPVLDENYYLGQIQLAQSKKDLSTLWQHAQNNQVPWTDNLNNAGIARMKVVAEQQ